MPEKYNNSNEYYPSNEENITPLNEGGLDVVQVKNKNKINEEVRQARHEFDYRSTKAYFKTKNPEEFKRTGTNLLANHPLFNVLYNLEKGNGISHYLDFQSTKINELNYIDTNAKNINDRSILEENAIPSLLIRYFNEQKLDSSPTKQQISVKIRELENLTMDLKLALDEIDFEIQTLIGSDIDSVSLMQKLSVLNNKKNSIHREIVGYQIYIDCVNQIMEDAQNIKNGNLFDNVISQIKKEIEDNNGEISLDMLKKFRQNFSSKRSALINGFPELKNADLKVNDFFDDIFRLLELSEFNKMNDAEKKSLINLHLMPQIQAFVSNSEIIKSIDDPKYDQKGISRNYKFMLEAEMVFIGNYFGLDLG